MVTEASKSVRWQFSLRMLFVVVTVIAVECALLANGEIYFMAGTIVAVLGLPVVGRLSNQGDINFWRGFFVAGLLSYWLLLSWWDSEVAACLTVWIVAIFGGLLAHYFYWAQADES